ncbi:MAG TPA: diacylglycerol kinase family protein [Streptosporangiaceae bacterium]|nr:diacylglycerol kinase family protein [Streptosporangiaceae bacterium]
MKAAVIVNPTKHGNLAAFHAMVHATMARHGWADPLWLETTPEETGRGLAHAAVAAQVDLVLASGGDGTVTACADGLAGSGVPLGVLPAGTGNLLARNLGLPLSLDEALVVGIGGADRRLDVGTANGRTFVAMAGLGFDAELLDSTGEPLKRRLGWVAYAVSGVRHLGERPVRASLRADDGPVLRRRASSVLIGNVGALQGGVTLLPGAEPDDGVLDLLVLTARGLVGWLALATDVLLRRRRTSHLARIAFRDLHVVLDRPQLWELDGEVIGNTRQLRVSVRPGALLVRVPARPG